MSPETEKLKAAYLDPNTTELMIIENGSAYVETPGAKLHQLPGKISLQTLGEFLQFLVGPNERFGPERPYGDLSATDGSRVHVIVPPLTRIGPCLTVRKRPTQRPSLQEIVDSGSLPPACAEFLAFAALHNSNFLIVGGTSSGKTTLLNAMASLVGPEDRFLVLEDTPELVLPQPHAIYLRTRLRDPRGNPDVTLRDLLMNALRMRPDRILIGEVRGPEAFDLLSAMNVGTDGVLATIHANSAREALTRLEVLTLTAGVDLPLKALRANMVQALDLIVVMARLRDGSRRVIQVTEVTGLEQDIITLSDLFKIDLGHAEAGENSLLKPTGSLPRLYEGLRAAGVACPLDWFKK